VWPERLSPWPVVSAEQVSIPSLEAIVESASALDILIVGCGPRFLPPPPDLRRALAKAGLVLEWMDTGAACRTFNVLLTENRAVAAALVAVD
jgi:uncharacterized protein